MKHISLEQSLIHEIREKKRCFSYTVFMGINYLWIIHITRFTEL